MSSIGALRTHVLVVIARRTHKLATTRLRRTRLMGSHVSKLLRAEERKLVVLLFLAANTVAFGTALVMLVYLQVTKGARPHALST